jgi:UTP:GlnB (protein PII) uridylyltransferase
VEVLPVAPSEWRIEVASRDVHGLLATVAGVLSDRGFDVVDAVVATWPDGGALESFLVRGFESPDAGALESAIVAAFGQPLSSPPHPDIAVHFDDDGSPWYSRCEVRTDDRRGVLRTIAVGIASARAEVHAARIAAESGQVVDRFDLTDTHGRKLDDSTKQAIRQAVASGVSPRRGRRRLAALTASRQERAAGRSRTRSDDETSRP